MNTLPIAPAAPAIQTLANKPAHPPLTAQTKAQRLRSHAQEKRGFKEHLEADQKAADRTKKDEQANKTEGAKPTSDTKEQKSTRAEAGQAAATAEQCKETDKPVERNGESRDASAAKPELKETRPDDQPIEAKDAEQPQNAQPLVKAELPEQVQRPQHEQLAHQSRQAEQAMQQPQSQPQTDQTSKQADEPFVQQVVAQVFQAVDPALKFKPMSLARATGSVSGNAAAAMRSTGTEQTPVQNANVPFANVPDAVAAPFAGAPEAVPATFDAPPQATPASALLADASRSQEKTTSLRGSAHASASPAAHASSAVDAAASAMNPAAAVAGKEGGRSVEPRFTLAPTLSTVAVGTSSLPVVSAQAGVAGKPAGSTPPPLAQQVQHGLEVAMQDLPAPAGDRLVTLRLHPSSLGSLRIAMHVSGDAVQVRFQVGSAKAKASIDKTMEDLKAAIGRQGLRIESMEVEEDRALAAPNGPSLDQEGRAAPAKIAENGPGVPSAAGKGFAQLLDAPRGPDGPSAAEAPDRTSSNAEAENEGGVLQVLTFRLEAVG